MIDFRSLLIVLPEIGVLAFALIMLLAAAACGSRVTRHIGIFAIIGFAIAGGVMLCPWRLSELFNGALPVFAFGKFFVEDSFIRFVKLVILVVSSLSIILSWDYFEKEDDEKPEYPVLVMFATLGMMLMVSAADLLTLYMGLEMQSLSLYVLAAIRRDDMRSSEAGLKYFVLGALSSGIFLYGASLLYGFAGTTDMVSLAYSLRDQAATHPGIVIGMVFVCAALTFKVAGVPFHMWAPDVYEGAPTPVTAFFATAPKIAALAVLARFLFQPMFGLTEQWHQIVAFVAVASMLWGAFAGIAQGNIKRMLAYSSISNVGYMLTGFMVGGNVGLQSVLIYVVIYAVGVMGTFAALLCLRRDGAEIEKIEDLAGLSQISPGVSFALSLFMFSLAGIPPLAGFFGKYFVFLAAVNAGLLPLAIIGVLSSVVAAYYYLRVVKVMYFDDVARALDNDAGFGVRATVFVTSVAVVCLTFVPSYLVEEALSAAKGFIV